MHGLDLTESNWVKEPTLKTCQKQIKIRQAANRRKDPEGNPATGIVTGIEIEIEIATGIGIVIHKNKEEETARVAGTVGGNKAAEAMVETVAVVVALPSRNHSLFGRRF